MNNPAWYLTPREFADIIVDVLDEQNYFKKDQKGHPEDIQIAFVSVSHAIAKGAMVAGQNVEMQQNVNKKKSEYELYNEL